MNNKFWRAHPLLKLLLPLVIGLILSSNINFIDKTQLRFLFLIAVVTCFFSLYLTWKSVGLKWLSGALILASFFILGVAIYQFEQVQKADDTPLTKTEKSTFLIKIQTEAQNATNTVKAIGKVMYHPSDHLVGKRILVYVEQKNAVTIKPGTLLIAHQYINEISAPKNPHEFDYKAYMAKQSIFYQAYLGSNIDQKIIAPATQGSILYQARQYGYRFIEGEISAQNQGIAKALLFGSKHSLGYDDKREFSRAGTMHILAVSGLHVGIIFMLLSSFITFLSRFISIPKIVKMVVMLFMIWWFVCLTGAKSSVVRAGIMFTVFTIGTLYFPKSYSLNSLALAAIILLMIHPANLFDVSFQLSFSAVSGILILVPFFREIGPRVIGYFPTYLLDITYVSLAAQISTLPFTLYYFQQFPTLGLVSNLLAIPLAFGIVSVGFIGFIFSFIPILRSITGLLVDVQLTILKAVNQIIADREFAVIENISLLDDQFILLLTAIGLLILMVQQKEKKWVFFILILFRALSSSISLQKWEYSNQKELTVYSLRNNLVLEYRVGRTIHCISSQPISDDSFRFSIQPNWKHHYIRKENLYSWEDKLTHKDFSIKDQTFFTQQRVISMQENLSSDIELVQSPDYTELYRLKKRSIEKMLILSDFYPKRVLPDSLHNLHFLTTEGCYQIEIQ